MRPLTTVYDSAQWNRYHTFYVYEHFCCLYGPPKNSDCCLRFMRICKCYIADCGLVISNNERKKRPDSAIQHKTEQKEEETKGKNSNNNQTATVQLTKSLWLERCLSSNSLACMWFKTERWWNNLANQPNIESFINFFLLFRIFN